MQRDLTDSEIYEKHYRFKERRSNARFFMTLMAILVAFFVFRAYWTGNFSGVRVDGASMNMTLRDGQDLVMRLSDGGKEAKRGDIIVVHVEHYPEVQELNKYRQENEKLKYLIKRLIAVEGDVVKCVDGQVMIKYAGAESFVALEESYAYYRNDAEKQGYDFAEYKVGEGEIFFLGDNRNNSVDSRYQEKGGSHLNGRLYKTQDIFGIVPAWAVEHRVILGKIFF